VTGLAFEHSLVAAISAISNTGPAFGLVTPENLNFARLSDSQRIILAFTMIIGRIEVLAVISLFNPDSWFRLSMRTKNTGNAPRKIAESKW
jgi:trk system potassium uptake protein TrkH